MTNPTRGAGRRQAIRRIRVLFSGRLPIVAAFGCLLLVNWVAAYLLIQYTYREREATALQMIVDQTQYSEQKITNLFEDADRTLLDLRERYSANNLGQALAHLPPARGSGGIALIEPDGHVAAMSAHANTSGWPRLMTRLAASGDILAVGEPIPGKNGYLGSIPIARRIVDPDGSFAGILLYSLESEALLNLSSAVAALDGCITLLSNEDVILARIPDVRGILGIRVDMSGDAAATRRDNAIVTGRHVSPLDGVDRIFSYHHLDRVPAALIVGIGYDATFAGWESLRLIIVSARLAGTALILLAGVFWYTRRGQAKISADALTAILASVDQGIRVESADGRVIMANSAGAALRLPVETNKPGEMDKRGETNKQADLPGPDGTIVRVTRHDLADGGAVLVGTDLTSRHDAEARISFLTDHDRLTGLPNRWRAASCIQDLIAKKSTSGRMAALILLDLDGFQDINDTLGHEGGDEVLIEIARRLRDLVSDRDIVARLGGDEFLLFLDDPDDEVAVMGLARQIPRTLARPIAVRGQQLHLGASLGIALYPRDGSDTPTLFRHADIALSRAKMAGRGSAQSFDPEMMVLFEENRMMESDLRRALDSDELEVRLQPQFSCETLDVTGFEALARWRHPKRGDLSPAVFIPIAERSGLINPLGLWAIEQSCRVAAKWHARQRVAVNLSPLQLRCETIQEDIRTILRRTQFPAHLLELEVTESVLLDEDQRTLETLHKLRAMDIRITLDDFGTGYSSLSYLRRFPFDKIKIDKSFIQGQGSDRGTRVILEAMIRMCTDLGFDVVAEGVETEAQLQELRQLGCREIQGFLLGGPLRPERVEEFLATHKRRLSSEYKNIEVAPT
ncbi:MAG: EAL domain-containing protein [Acetobacteraceae bacterium]